MKPQKKNEMEISGISDKELKMMVLKMIIKFRIIKEKHNENFKKREYKRNYTDVVPVERCGNNRGRNLP